MFSSHQIRHDFPQLKRTIHGKPIVYLDSTATSLKPSSVIAKLTGYYKNYTANVFRGIYTTSEEATYEYEQARSLVASFIGAESEEVVFTRNTTESINLVAYSLLPEFSSGSRIVTTIMEHHSNFVPWQQLGKDRGIAVYIWNIDTDGMLQLAQLEKLITRKTKLLTFTACSNVLGTITPVSDIVKAAKRLNPDCLVLVDAAQAVPHMPVDVRKWGADFVAFSSHKMLGPTGIGVLWAKPEHLDRMRPFNFGGEMISEVHVDRTEFKKAPHKFEAGTPHIAGAIGLGAAVTYLSALGMDYVRKHEETLVSYALQQFHTVSGLSVLGPTDPHKRGAVFAFTLKGAHPHDIAQLLNEDNIFVRAGNHCAMPLHEHLGIAATARASCYVYTTKSDIDALVRALEKVKNIFA